MPALLVTLFLCVTPYSDWSPLEIDYAYRQFVWATDFWSDAGLGYTVKPVGVYPLDCTDIEGLNTLYQLATLRSMETLPQYSIVLTKSFDFDGFAGMAYVGGPIALVKWQAVSPAVVGHEMGHLLGALDCEDDPHDRMCEWGNDWVAAATLQRMRRWLGQGTLEP